MKGIQYQHANCVLLGVRPDVYDLPICKFEYSDGTDAVESCWKMTFREKLRVLFTGRIYFQCWGRTHPPINMTSKSVMYNGFCFRDKNGWPVECIKGKYFTNFMRIIINTNIKKTIGGIL